MGTLAAAFPGSSVTLAAQVDFAASDEASRQLDEVMNFGRYVQAEFRCGETICIAETERGPAEIYFQVKSGSDEQTAFARKVGNRWTMIEGYPPLMAPGFLDSAAAALHQHMRKALQQRP